MLQRKICLLGAPGVGKRSLLSTCAHTTFSANYVATIGAQISKRTVSVGEQSIEMMVWDIAYYEGFEKVAMNSLRGMSGYLLVADGTRPSTLERAGRIYEQVYSFEQPPPTEPNPSVPYVQFPYRKIPFLLLLSKSDLTDQWRFTDSDIQKLTSKGWPVLKSSAKDNWGVEEAFLTLGQKNIELYGRA
jgi:GTPase SAR1 family protein